MPQSESTATKALCAKRKLLHCELEPNQDTGKNWNRGPVDRWWGKLIANLLSRLKAAWLHVDVPSLNAEPCPLWSSYAALPHSQPPRRKHFSDFFVGCLQALWDSFKASHCGLSCSPQVHPALICTDILCAPTSRYTASRKKHTEYRKWSSLSLKSILSLHNLFVQGLQWTIRPAPCPCSKEACRSLITSRPKTCAQGMQSPLSDHVAIAFLSFVSAAYRHAQDAGWPKLVVNPTGGFM